MMMAFLAAQQLGITDKGVLCFTYIDNFLACLTEDRVNLCTVISAHFHLIVMGPDSDIRRAGNKGNAAVQQLYEFCGYDLVQAKVFTYPPLSFT
jgi:hypothetical protein